MNVTILSDAFGSEFNLIVSMENIFQL